MDHVSDIIPNSLCLFLIVLFGGENILEFEEQDDSLKVRICNIAQYIVYTASKSRKLTPKVKHVGLGLALHQATRSEKKKIHAAGHTVGIYTLRRIDSSIGNDILRRYEQNGYIYIPTGISPYTPGRTCILLSSFDNIDVLEETIDGKHTFHVTQCVLWQHGPPNTTRTNDCKKQEEIEYLIGNYLINFSLLRSHLYTLVQGQIQS